MTHSPPDDARQRALLDAAFLASDQEREDDLLKSLPTIPVGAMFADYSGRRLALNVVLKGQEKALDAIIELCKKAEYPFIWDDKLAGEMGLAFVAVARERLAAIDLIAKHKPEMFSEKHTISTCPSDVTPAQMIAYDRLGTQSSGEVLSCYNTLQHLVKRLGEVIVDQLEEMNPCDRSAAADKVIENFRKGILRQEQPPFAIAETGRAEPAKPLAK